MSSRYLAAVSHKFFRTKFYTDSLSHECFMSNPSVSSRFCHRNYICRRIKIMIFPSTQLYPSSCCFLPLGFKYEPQSRVFKTSSICEYPSRLGWYAMWVGECLTTVHYSPLTWSNTPQDLNHCENLTSHPQIVVFQ